MKSKYLIILIVLVLLIASCNLTGEIYPYDWKAPIEINTVQQALDYVQTYTYKPNNTVFLPDEFYKKGYGDCEEFALMFQYIMETKLNIDVDLVAGHYMNSTVGHMWVEGNGNIYEPTAGMINNYLDLYKEEYRYHYPDSIYMVRSYGGFLK